MNRPALASLFVLCALTGCATSGSSTSISPNRNYNGTASGGDFLTMSINSAANTIDYSNRSNGDSGTVPYTVDSDGTYSITHPQGNLLNPHEVSGFVLLAETATSGPLRDTPAADYRN